MPDTPDDLTITLARTDWMDVLRATDQLPHPPSQDLPGITRLVDALGAAGVE